MEEVDSDQNLRVYVFNVRFYVRFNVLNIMLLYDLYSTQQDE